MRAPCTFTPNFDPAPFSCALRCFQNEISRRLVYLYVLQMTAETEKWRFFFLPAELHQCFHSYIQSKRGQYNLTILSWSSVMLERNAVFIWLHCASQGKSATSLTILPMVKHRLRTTSPLNLLSVLTASFSGVKSSRPRPNVLNRDSQCCAMRWPQCMSGRASSRKVPSVW